MICIGWIRGIIFQHYQIILYIYFKRIHYKTTRGDWIELIKNDFELIGETFDEVKFKSMSKYQIKKFIKNKISQAAFKYLETLKNSH